MGRKLTPESGSAGDPINLELQQMLSRSVTRTNSRVKESQKRGNRSVWPIIRLFLIWSGVLLSAGVLAAAYFQGERFVSHDARFRLASPEELGQDSAGIEVIGATYTSRSAISQLFERDYGRSTLRIPLAQRRAELMQLNWVKDASIQRIWPNHLKISIQERVPAAFVLLTSPSTGSAHYALIDAEGVFLPPPVKADFHLPVITGTDPDEILTQRRKKVQAVLRLFQEIGSYGDKVSEVDVLHLDNISVTEPLDGHAMTLVLGSSNFRKKLANFQNYIGDIQHRFPDVTKLDLRLEDRINAMNRSSEATGAAGGR